MNVQGTCTPSALISNDYQITHTDPMNKAAVTIQKCFRGYLAKRPFLPRNLFSRYKAQCIIADGPAKSSMPRARNGRTPVYLPYAMPSVVLKRSGRAEAIERFHQMQGVRCILAAQNSRNLVIPQARLCREFLVEEKLPIVADSYHNMRLYLSDPQLFNEAIRELTRLFSEIFISDLLDHQINPLGNIKDVWDFVRYDNLSLYIVENKGEKEGRIALIDLEGVENKPSPKALQLLVRIFPLHLDLIKEVAMRLGMNEENDVVMEAAMKGRKYLQVGFADHLEWLKQKGVLNKDVGQALQISRERENSLKHLVEEELLKCNQGINDLFKRKRYLNKPLCDFLTEDPSEVAKELAEIITPMIIANLKNQIETTLGSATKQHLSESELVSLRSPILKRPELHRGVDNLIKKSSKTNFNENDFDHIDIAEQLAHVVIQELIKGGELFSYDPAYYTCSYKRCWLRF